jgi:hypothetical protein
LNYIQKVADRVDEKREAGHKLMDTIAAMTPNLKAELLPPVISRSLPREAELTAVDG